MFRGLKSMNTPSICGFDYYLSCCDLNYFVIVTATEELSHTLQLHCTAQTHRGKGISCYQMVYTLGSSCFEFIILVLICAERCGLICFLSDFLRPVLDREMTVAVTPMVTAVPELFKQCCSALASVAGLWATSPNTAISAASWIYLKWVLSEVSLLHLFLLCPLGCCASSCWLKKGRQHHLQIGFFPSNSI